MVFFFPFRFSDPMVVLPFVFKTLGTPLFLERPPVVSAFPCSRLLHYSDDKFPNFKNLFPNRVLELLDQSGTHPAFVFVPFGALGALSGHFFPPCLYPSRPILAARNRSPTSPSQGP